MLLLTSSRIAACILTGAGLTEAEIDWLLVNETTTIKATAVSRAVAGFEKYRIQKNFHQDAVLLLFAQQDVVPLGLI